MVLGKSRDPANPDRRTDDPIADHHPVHPKDEYHAGTHKNPDREHNEEQPLRRANNFDES